MASSIDRHCRGLVEQSGEVGGRNRPAEVVALNFVAAFRLEEGKLLGRLDPLGARPHAERASEADHRAHDGVGLAPGLESADEGAVDLDRVERELLQVAETRVARAEIIHGDAHAEFAELAESAERRLHVGEENALGDLELQPVRLEAGILQHAADEADEDRRGGTGPATD